MFTRLVSMRSPLIVRHGRNPSNLPTEGIGSGFEQNEEFTKWWEQWVRRLQWGSANARYSQLTESRTAACHRG